MWLGSYEPEIQRKLMTYDLRGKIALDIGANVGFYSLLFSRLVGENGRVMAFEPLPRNIMYLRKHLQLNKIANVEIYECAIADRDGVFSFDTSKHNAQARITERGNINVQARSLDSIEREVDRAVALLKIDVEGAEILVLNGGKEFIRKHRPAILLSTHGQKQVIQTQMLSAELTYSMAPLSEKVCGANPNDEWILLPSF